MSRFNRYSTHNRPKETGEDLSPQAIERRNALVTKFMPMIRATAARAMDNRQTDYTFDEMLSYLYEVAIVAATKHCRRNWVKQDDDGAFPKYLKIRLFGGVKDFLSRERPMFPGYQVGYMNLDTFAAEETTENMQTSSYYDNPERKMIRADTDREREANTSTAMEQLNKLTDRQRQAATLVYLEGMKQLEAAAVMGIKEAAIARLLDRGLVALRQHCENNGVKSDTFFTSD